MLELYFSVIYSNFLLHIRWELEMGMGLLFTDNIQNRPLAPIPAAWGRQKLFIGKIFNIKPFENLNFDILSNTHARKIGQCIKYILIVWIDG